MKTFFSFIFLLCLSFVSHAQLSFAIINDKDGFVNIRKDKNAHSPVVGKIFDESIFGYDPDEKSNWVKIYKQDEDKLTDLEGYMDRSRIMPLATFKKIYKPKIYRDSCVIQNNTLALIIKSSVFNPSLHKLDYEKPSCKNCATFLNKIDNKRIWGTDGGLPRKFISSLRLIQNNVEVIIPKNAIDNLYEPNFSSLKVYLSANNIYIQMDNSDGAGGYTVIWTIKNHQFLKRYIDNYYD